MTEKKHSFISYAEDENDYLEQREQIKSYWKDISETLMSVRVNVDKKKELEVLSRLQRRANYYGAIFAALEKKDISWLRRIADENARKHSSYVENPITDKEIKELIQLVIVNDMRITSGLDYMKSYFDKKSDQNQMKIFPGNFTTYRKIQTDHMRHALEHLTKEIKNIQNILAGNTNERSLSDAEAIKDRIDLYNGKITHHDYSLNTHTISSSDFADIKDIISSFPYKKLKKQQKEYNKLPERRIELENYTSVHKLDAEYTPEGKIKFTGFDKR